MEKKDAGKRSKKPVQKGRSSVFQLILPIMVFAALVYFALPSVLVLLAAMLPMIVALIVERGKNRYAWICVGGATFVVTCPYLIRLWQDGQSISGAVDILSSIPAWLVMYSGAAFGWGLYVVIPLVVGVCIEFLIKRRIATQRSLQRKLIEQWGDGVAEEEQVEKGKATGMMKA